MPAYALVRIKKGAKCFQDHSLYTWPPSDYGEEGRRIARVEDDAVFIGEKMGAGANFRWKCKTHGAGIIGGDYGNGAIFVSGDDCVEMLTPMLGYEPELPAPKVEVAESSPASRARKPRDDFEFLIDHFADGRKICNCQNAYQDETGGCKHGCSANQIAARRYIAKRVREEFLGKGGKKA